MVSLQGLPPLPKSLSGLLNFSSAQWRELEHVHNVRTMVQQDMGSSASPQLPGSNLAAQAQAPVPPPRGGSPHAAIRKSRSGSRSGSGSDRGGSDRGGSDREQTGDLRGSPRSHRTSPSLSADPQSSPGGTRGGKNTSLDAQLALLRKEMVGLRQLDMSLLCQLWSLNESIQDFKAIVSERQSVAAWDNGYEASSADEGEEFFTPRRDGRFLHPVAEQYMSSSSSSQSSLEFGDI